MLSQYLFVVNTKDPPLSRLVDTIRVATGALRKPVAGQHGFRIAGQDELLIIA